MAKIENGERLKFVPVEDPKVLLPILEERKPQSCFVWNQVMLYEKETFKSVLRFYTLGNEINSNTWIVMNYIREDYGYNISISAPVAIVEGKEPVPLHVKEEFSLGDVINWDEGMVFVALEKRVSAMIVDISANVKGNVTELHPCILYFMDKDEALTLEICPGPDFRVRSLNPETETDFILKTWKYSTKGSDKVLRQSIEGAASAGVFFDGKCVSGVITGGNGLISSLYTLKEYRNRGLAKLTMKYAFKECAKDGCFPCSTVEVRNERSIAFHQSLGVSVASIVDWIDVKKLEVD